MAKIKLNNAKEIILVFLITLVLTFFILKIGKINFKIPMKYSGDGLLLGYNVKTIQESGWWFKNPRVGAPFGGTVYDFPFYFDTLNLIVFKTLLFIFNDWGKSINAFYILLFPLTAATSYFTMRKFKVTILLSTLGSLNYTFLQYRFLRGTAHFFLSAYYLLPLTVLLFYWLYEDNDFFIINKNFFKSKKNLFSIILLILLSMSGIYYTFFLCFFMFLISIITLQKNNIIIKFRQLISSYLIIFSTILILYIPGLFYNMSNGINTERPMRAAFESEIYGLRLSRLFLSQHLFSSKWKILERISKEAVSYSEYIKNSEGTEYLGLIGMIGFLFLIIVIIKNSQSKNKPIQFLSQLTIGATLLGITSGFGLLFSIFISSQIRAYNRITVYIAYFCILAVCIYLSSLTQKKKSIFLNIAIIFIFLFATWEQIPQNIDYKASRKAYEKEYNSDEKITAYIEKTLGDNAMVFQLPYFKFPEAGNIGNLHDYDLFRGYLHSKTLKWSYGGYKGRDSDLWNREISSLPMIQMLEKISIAGFKGLYIDKRAYTEKEYKELESQLKTIIRSEPYFSDDGNIVFFNLLKYNDFIKTKYSTEEFKVKKDILLYTNIIYDGLYYEEKLKDLEWHWSTNKVTILIVNNMNSKVNYKLKTKLKTGYPENSLVTIEYNGKTRKYLVNNIGTDIEINENFPNGKNIIKITTNAKQIESYPDARELYIKFENMESKIQ